MDDHTLEEYANTLAQGTRSFTKEDQHAWEYCFSILDKKIQKTLKCDFPCSLRNPVNRDAYIAIVDYYLSMLSDHEKISIVAALNKYSGDRVDTIFYKPIIPLGSLIEYAYKKINCSREIAALAMGRLIEITPEKCFDTFSPQKNLFMDGYRLKTKVSDEYIPKSLSAYGKKFILQDPMDDDLDYSGNIEQAKCRYFDSEGNHFYFMAARIIPEEMNKGFLSIGRKPVTIRLLSRKEMNDNPYATVLLCQDENISYFLRKQLKEDGHGESSNFVVSGYWEHADAQKYIDFSPLVGHNVVIVPPITENGLKSVPEWIKQCQRGGASTVRVYKGMLLLNEMPMASEESPTWLRTLASHVIPLYGADTTVLKNIVDESISSKEYDEWLHDCGLKQQRLSVVEEKNKQSLISFEKLCDIEVTEDVVEYKLDAMISPSNATLIWGPSNVGKTFAVLEFVKSLTTGEDCFGFKNSFIRNVYYLDGESDLSRLHRVCQQICHMNKQFSNLQKHFVYGKPQEHMTLDKISDDEIDCIIKGIKENKCQVVVLDNILSLAPQTAKGNTTKFQKFIQSLKNNNISTIIIHHSTKGGESPKGPVELEALMQNVFRLERGEDLPELRSVEAVRTALGEAGPTMKMTLTKCKVFPGLEKKFGVYHLPEGGGWKLVAGESFSEITTIDDTSSVAEMTAEALEFSTAEGNSSKLSSDEEKVYNLLKKLGKPIKRAELEKDCGFKADKLRLLLKSLIEKKFVTKTGQGKSTHYQAS